MMNGNQKTNENYPQLDLLKYLCSVGIIGQHTRWFADIPYLDTAFQHFQPTLVALFFVISSVLFWGKVKWNREDAHLLWHFSLRLLTLVGCWGVLLMPHWLPKFIRHNPDWLTLLLSKILYQGMTQGSWFIMSLIYGTLLCYLLNKYLNRHLVFILTALCWLYFSLVHYEGLPDFMSLYSAATDDSFHFESYYSPIRSIIWIEAGFYLVPWVRDRFSSGRMIVLIIASFMLFVILKNGYFPAIGLIAIMLAAFGMQKSDCTASTHYITLRQMSIVTFFAHFPIVTAIHTLYTSGLISGEFGLMPFLVTFTLSSSFAFFIIKSSNRYKWLKLFY